MAVRWVGKPDPLVADATPAKPVVVEPPQDEWEARWRAFPGANAPRHPCRWCKDMVTVGCGKEHYGGCANWAAAERRRKQEKPHV